MRHPNLLRKDDTVLVIVDIQTKLLNVIFEKARVLSSCSKLIRAAKILEIPMIMTEQYPKGMGRTDPEILKLLQDTKAIEKLHFSCCGAEDFNKKIEESGKKPSPLSKRSSILVDALSFTSPVISTPKSKNIDSPSPAGFDAKELDPGLSSGRNGLMENSRTDTAKIAKKRKL